MAFFRKFIITLISHVLVLAVFQSVGSSPSSITTDREALLSFKFQITTFIEPNPLSTWDQQDLSPCNWTRVSCDDQSQRVIGLDLSNLEMSGPISPHIGNLSSLRTLNLSFNTISGKIPTEIGHLTRLQVLNLASNRLTGNFPPSLTNITSLVDLNLGTNNLHGPLPTDFSRLVNLKFLDLTVNNLSGSLPPSIYNISSLVDLDLSSNSFRGEIPRDIGITLPNLLRLRLCVNQFTGTIPPSLHNLTNIRIIRIGNNLLHGRVPPGLENLRDLEEYNIGSNSITGRSLDFVESLTNSTRLHDLAFDSNLLEGSIPRSIGNLSKVLTRLFMGGNDIHGTIPPSIGDLKGLQLLNLSYASLSGEIPPEIGMLKELRVLGLADSTLSGKIPDSLGDLRHLTEIDLSKNKLLGNIPSSFGYLQDLLSVDLSCNELNGSLPKEIFNLPRLSLLLNLSRNHLSGSLPVEIGSLKNIAVIDLSENMFTGDIPRSFLGCESLVQLSLAGNELTGPIPEALASIRGLESLDLSSNQLSGSIPFRLQTLTSLQLLNLSFNNLEGEIPEAGVFAHPFKVHLEGNRDICNPPGEKCKRKSTSFYVIVISISCVTVLSICFSVVLICYYIRRGNNRRVKDSFELSTAHPDTISYEEIRLATDNFNRENLVGQGSFGLVYKGVVQGKTIAIKVLDSTRAKSKKMFLAECAALRLLRHRNLIRLATVCSSIDSRNEEFLALVFEFMSNGSLHDWVNGERKGLTFLDRVRLATGIASAVDYLHNGAEVPIVHCDLKPSNVLLDSSMTPKVGDFGLAKLLLDSDKQMSTLSSGLRGSIGYIPPEYGYGEKPSMAGDVYSYGILLLELFTGKGPTHELFAGGLTLKSWVQMHFPTDIDQVLDFDLLQETESFSDCKVSTQRDCLIEVLGVGLSCAGESVGSRLTIRDVLRQLENAGEMLREYECVVIDDGDETS